MIRYQNAKETVIQGVENKYIFGKMPRRPATFHHPPDSPTTMNQPSNMIQLLDMVISKAARVALIVLHPLTAGSSIGIVKGLEEFLRV